MNHNYKKIYRFPIHISWQIEPKEKIVYIINKKNNKFFYFDNVSKDIWLLIEEGFSVSEIISNLSNIYKIDCNELQEDVIEFINQLYEEGVIVEKDEKKYRI